MLSLLLLTGLALAAGLWLWTEASKRRHMPPGEWGWPVVGHFPQSGEALEDTVKTLRKKHGNIFTWCIGARTFVVLGNFETIKRVLNHPGAQDRPDFLSFKIFTKYKNLGLFNVNGEMWQMSRRFTIRHLRNMGMGKSTLEDAAVFEAARLVEDFKKHTDTPNKLPISLSIAILNITWKLTADHRYELDDPAIQKFQKMVVEMFSESQRNVALFDMFPYLERFTPRFVYKLLGVTKYMAHCDKFLAYIHDVVEEHKRNLDPDNPKDFIDAFLLEMHKDVNKGSDVYTEDNLVVSVGDIFTAASETTSITLRWILFYMIKHPEIQTRVQAELDGVVPRDRLPGLQDRDKLNFTEATFTEIGRVLSLAPLGAPHQTSEKMEIEGYKIPKGTILFADFEGCHNDPAVWEKPSELYPEHFLDSEGKFVEKKESYAPFSLGRRVCPGENLAKQTIFLFGSALLQNFTFSAPEGVTFTLDRDPMDRTFKMPKPLKVVIKSRA